MPPTQLDATYQERRVALSRHVEDVAAKLWVARDWGDRSSFTAKAIPMVEGGMRVMVSLVDAYMTSKSRVAAGDPHLRLTPLVPSDIGVEDVRGVPASEVYDRPFGALGQKLAEGAQFVEADNYAADYVRKLVVTDLQLAYTTASAMWIGLNG